MNSLLRTAARLSFVAGLGLAALGVQAFELRGFRGVSWGEGAEALGEAHAVHKQGEVTCYQRDRENLVFGDSALQGVQYCFHQDRLFMVVLDAAVSQKALIAEFQRTYGAPTSRMGQSVAWGGPASGTQAELAPRAANTARLAIYSNKIEPAVARRMQKPNPAEVTRELAAAY
ncbi:MAG TPA: hypothetical protein VFL64_19475 [Rhizobacter sp.]|nr:hypothetical protein [Rhizobacter sp.]